MRLWRVFPWDATAKARAPFASRYLPPKQGAGRFDVPNLTPVWYFAESPEHAVAELIQGFRGRSLTAAALTRFGHPLALVAVDCVLSCADRVVDLCDPVMLQEYDIRPDALASRDGTITRAIARSVYQRGATGLRWWSSFSGDWHTIVLFDRAVRRSDLHFGTPEPLRLTSPAVREAASILDVGLPE